VINLEPGCLIEGMVLDTAGKPVEGASIYLNALAQGYQRGEGALAQTAADGGFVLDSAAPGPNVIWASHPFHTAASAAVTAEGGGAAHVGVVLGDGGTIEGVVTRGGQPVADAIVQTLSMTTRSDGTGAYRVTHVPPGEVTMKVILNGADGYRRGTGVPGAAQAGTGTNDAAV